MRILATSILAYKLIELILQKYFFLLVMWICFVRDIVKV